MSQTAVVINTVPVSGVSEGIVPGVRSALVRAAEGPAGGTALAREVADFSLSNAELLASVERCRPPQSWYDEDHEGLY